MGLNGFKFTSVDRDVFLITLLCNNEEKDCRPNWFVTTDCIVEDIVNMNTNESVDEIDGFAFYKFRYKKGAHIIGTEIYYCHSVDDLFDSYFIKKTKKTGRIERTGYYEFYYKLAKRIIAETREQMRNLDK